MTKYGYTMLRKIKSRYDELFKKYDAITVEETYDEYGCEWMLGVDEALFRFEWNYRDWLSSDIFGIDVMLGCPDAQSSLNEWWNWFTILEFIAYLWNLPQPSLDEGREPHMIELIIKFIRDPNYQQWCCEFDHWLKTRVPKWSC